MVKTLKETTEMMVSPDYNERFKAEYYQLVFLVCLPNVVNAHLMTGLTTSAE